MRVELLRQQPAGHLVPDGPIDHLPRRLQVRLALGGGDVPLGEPQGAQEPRVARHVRRVRLDPEVIVVRVAGDASGFGLVGELVGDRLHRVRDSLILRRVHAEPPETMDRAVEHRVDGHRFVVLDSDPAREASQLGAVQVGVGCLAQPLGGVPVARISRDVAEHVREAARRVETAPHRSDRERVHAPALLPQVPRRDGKAVALVDVAHHPVRRRHDEGRVKVHDEVEVAVDAVVLPQRPQHQPCLVLLDRQRASTV